MKSSIKNNLMLLFIVAVLTSCNYGETLQSYYVANQETPDFISLDVPVDMVNLDESTLSEVQQEAYQSIDKLNMLAFRLNENNKEDYKVEYNKVKQILKNDKYEELFRGGNTSDGRFVVKYIGSDTTIDELIVFGSANDKGFAIVRVLGNDMEPAKIMKLGDALKNANPDQAGLDKFMDFFK